MTELIIQEDKVASLLPRQFKIKHSVNEFDYFVMWISGVWVIQLGTLPTYLTNDYRTDFFDTNTAKFSTPEEALEFWVEFINQSKWGPK